MSSQFNNFHETLTLYYNYIKNYKPKKLIQPQAFAYTHTSIEENELHMSQANVNYPLKIIHSQESKQMKVKAPACLLKKPGVVDHEFFSLEKLVSILHKKI